MDITNIVYAFVYYVSFVGFSLKFESVECSLKMTGNSSILYRVCKRERFEAQIWS